MKLILTICCFLCLASLSGVVAASTPPAHTSTLGVNFGRYDGDERQRRVNEGRIERTEFTASRVRFCSYRVEIAELHRGSGRAHISIFGDVFSTFSADTQMGQMQLVEVEMHEVSLDQFGAPIAMITR